MRCAKTLGNGCRGPTGRALRQPTPVELVTCEWPPGLRPSWPPYPPARATGAVAATTFSLSAGLPKQHFDPGDAPPATNRLVNPYVPARETWHCPADRG